MKKILLTSIAALAIVGTANADSTLNDKVTGPNGEALIFNESDGGGAKFTNNNGVESFVGVHDGGNAEGLAAQIYADKKNDEGKWEGAKLDVTNAGIYYTVGSDSFAERAVEANKLATIGNIAFSLTQANAYTDAQIDKLEKNISGGVAAATALSSVEVSNVEQGEMSVGGGYGYYNGESAGAFGAALGLTDDWSVNAGAGIATGDKTQVSFRAGTNYKFKLF